MISMILMRIVIMMMVVVVVVSIIGLVLMVVMTNPILIMVAVLEEGTAMTHAVLSTKSRRMLETANTTRPTRRREGCSLHYPCLLELILMIRKMDNGQQSPL